MLVCGKERLLKGSQGEMENLDLGTLYSTRYSETTLSYSLIGSTPAILAHILFLPLYPRGMNMIKKLIELSSWENLTRNDLLSLANLPENFELRALPDFPTTEEAAKIVGNIYRHQSQLTDAWPVLHKKVSALPKLVHQA